MELKLIRLEISHADEIMALRDYALNHLSNQDDYIIESDEKSFVERHLGPEGISIGFRLNNKLLGYSALTTDIYKYGDKDEIALLMENGEQRWGALAATVVAPEARGLGLQRKFIRLRKQFAKEAGLTHLGVVVSTKNVASLLNLIREGAILKKMIEFEDGRIRYLLSMETCNRPNTQNVVSVISPPDKNELINRLLGADYLGDEVVDCTHGKYLKFSKEREYDD